MGNLMSSPPEGSRKMNPFTYKMAEGAFVKETGAPSGAISCVLYFEELPSAASLETLLREKLLSFDVFRSKHANGRWVEVDFDLSKHCFDAIVNSEAELLAYAEAEMMKPLRNGLEAPLWEVHSVTNRAGRSMLFFRIEHAIGDGIALNQVLSRLASNEAGGGLPPASYTRPPKKPRPLLALLLEGLKAIFKYLSAPMGPYDADSPLVCARRLRSALKFGTRRKIVLVPEHSLGLIKRVKNAASAAAGVPHTVNDVVFAATAGALRRYCLAVDPAAPLEGQRIRALTPLAFPRTADAPLSNDWCFLDVPMPCALPTPAARLRAAHATFDPMKNGPEPAIAKFFTDQNCNSPGFLFGKTAQQVMQRYSLVFSNVPGPPAPVFVGGRRLLGVHALYPNLIMQHLCVSYNGTMYMNFVVDPEVVTRHETLPLLYLDELRALAVHYGVDPDDGSSPV